jgi:hypothetical protein
MIIKFVNANKFVKGGGQFIDALNKELALNYIF